MGTIDNTNSQPPGLGETFVNGLVYVITFQWLSDLFSYIGSYFSGDAKMKQTVNHVDEEAPVVQNIADHVENVVKNPLQVDPPVATPIKKVEDIIAQSSAADRSILILRESKEALAGESKRKTLTPEKYQGYKNLFQRAKEQRESLGSRLEATSKFENPDNIQEGLFNSKLDRLTELLKTFGKEIDNFDAKLKPLETAERQAKERYIKIEKQLGNLEDLTPPLDNHELFLKENPHVAHAKKDAGIFTPTFSSLLRQLRQ